MSIFIIMMLLHIVPFVITQLILCNCLPGYTGSQKKILMLTVTPVNIVINMICAALIYSRLFGFSKPWSELPQRIIFQCSYKDIERIGTGLAIFYLTAFLVGIIESILLNGQLPQFSRCKKGIFILISVLMLIPVIEMIKISYEGKEKIIISEVCRKMTVENEIYTDDDASYVVIKNTGAFIYEIDTMYLTDNEDGENGLEIRNVTLKPGEEYRYTMAGSDGLDIKKRGGTIVNLTDKNGRIIDSVAVPELEKMQSYKLTGSDWKIVRLAEDGTVAVSEPQFSAESGFYDDAFELILSAEEGVKIYYTTDSSNPTEESTLYTAPIYVYDRSEEANQYRSVHNVYNLIYYDNIEVGKETVDKCFVVRAVAIDADGKRSDVITQTYFVGLDKYKDSRVISLVSDPDDLFGGEGIYVTGEEFDEWYEAALKTASEGELPDATDMPTANFYKRGKDWERLTNFELFDSGVIINNQSAGIRIQGASARNEILKRFSIYSRKIYSGSKWFDTDFFEGVRTHSVVLREGEANAISQGLASDRAAVNIPGEQVVVFLDGEYWYTTYLYENLCEAFFAEHYHVNENDVILARDGVTVTENTDTENTFEYLTDYIESHDLNDEENYAVLQQMMDVQSYIDYWAINIYLANMDVAEDKNIVAWRTAAREDKEYGDGRWRWVFYDMDLLTSITRAYIPNVDTDAEVNSFNKAGAYAYIKIDEGVFWKALTVNSDFCRQFVLSFMDIVNTNFSLPNVENVLEEYGFDISYDDYFFRERAKYIVPDLAEEFGLTGTQETVTLFSDGADAAVTLNTVTLELMQGESWSGTYFTDYPVTVTASSPDFDHWEVVSDGQTVIYNDATAEVPVVKGGVEIHAVFR